LKIGIKKKLESILKRFAPKQRLQSRIKFQGEIISLESQPVDTDYKEAKAE